MFGNKGRWVTLRNASANGFGFRSFPRSQTAASSSRHLFPSRRFYSMRENEQVMQQHNGDVAKIAAQVRSFYDRGQQFRISHGSTNSTRKGALGRDPKTTVNTGSLNRVLAVDIESKTALVEPNVPMDKLVEETLKYGLIPSVVMEFPGITVGGGYSGTSGESSSFKHGFFDRTLESVEIVLADGQVLICSKDSHADLFHGAAGALGTLGVTTMVTLRLREAKRYVQTTYHPVSSVQEAVNVTQKLADPQSDLDYVDGIMYSSTEGAIITGRMTNTLRNGLSVQRFSEPSDPWFYLHVKEKISNSTAPTSEVIPLPEYLFRYDRGGFWVGEAPFSYFVGMPFNKWTRRWLDDFLHTRMLYKALHGSGQSEKMIIQDLALPYENATEFINFTDSRLGIWPLWLCPLKQSPLPTMHPHYREYQSDGKTLKPMLNIGLWGWAPRGDFQETNHDIELKLTDLRGMKWNYAQNFHSEGEFWKDFEREWYNGLRQKYDALSLPDVYDKVRSRNDPPATVSWRQRLLNVWPISGLYGLRKAVQSGDYLLARNAKWKTWLPRT